MHSRRFVFLQKSNPSTPSREIPARESKADFTGMLPTTYVHAFLTLNREPVFSFVNPEPDSSQPINDKKRLADPLTSFMNYDYICNTTVLALNN